MEVVKKGSRSAKKTTYTSPIINEYGKLPPQAPELEEAVLGASC